MLEGGTSTIATTESGLGWVGKVFGDDPRTVGMCLIWEGHQSHFHRSWETPGPQKEEEG